MGWGREECWVKGWVGKGLGRGGGWVGVGMGVG